MDGACRATEKTREKCPQCSQCYSTTAVARRVCFRSGRLFGSLLWPEALSVTPLWESRANRVTRRASEGSTNTEASRVRVGFILG